MLTDVVYGPYDRNKLDVYLAEGAGPTPVVIYLHGGGYRNGDKAKFADYIHSFKDSCIAANISFVSANYRFITESPFPAPMEDGTRIIQFVRFMAKEWNLIPEQIAASGGSAGAHISLWNAMKGDLSDRDSEDAIARCPSAVSGVVCFRGQASKDQHFYKDIYSGEHIQPNLRLFYGLDEEEDLESPKVRKLSYEASAINFVSAQSPPALMIYTTPFTEPFIPADTSVSEVIHHPIHGYILKKRMEQQGRTCIFRHAADPLQEGEIVRFLTNCFRNPE